MNTKVCSLSFLLFTQNQKVSSQALVDVSGFIFFFNTNWYKEVGGVVSIKYV